MPSPNNFPTAERHDPIFTIGGQLYRKVNQSDGVADPKAIRALITLDKPDANGATTKLAWFTPLELPEGYRYEADEAA